MNQLETLTESWESVVCVKKNVNFKKKIKIVRNEQALEEREEPSWPPHDSNFLLLLV